MAEQLDDVDFALAVYREEGVWQVQELAHDLLVDVETVAHALRRFPGDFGAVALADGQRATVASRPSPETVTERKSAP